MSEHFFTYLYPVSAIHKGVRKSAS